MRESSYYFRLLKKHAYQKVYDISILDYPRKNKLEQNDLSKICHIFLVITLQVLFLFGNIY